MVRQGNVKEGQRETFGKKVYEQRARVRLRGKHTYLKGQRDLQNDQGYQVYTDLFGKESAT